MAITDPYIKFVADLITAGEGDYTAVNPNDVVSIGRFQWYGARALNIARQIANADPTGTKAALGDTLYNQVSGGNNNVWNNWRPNTSEITALKAMLSLPSSVGIQDNQATTDIRGYISSAKSTGMVDQKAIAYYCDLYNQSPKQAVNIVRAAGGGNGLTLDKIHQFAMQNSVMSKYATRRNRAYNTCKNWGSPVDPPETPPINPPDTPGSGSGGSTEAPNPPKEYIIVNNNTPILYNQDYPSGKIFYETSQKVYVPKGGN